MTALNYCGIIFLELYTIKDEETLMTEAEVLERAGFPSKKWEARGKSFLFRSSHDEHPDLPLIEMVGEIVGIVTVAYDDGFTVLRITQSVQQERFVDEDNNHWVLGLTLEYRQGSNTWIVVCDPIGDLDDEPPLDLHGTLELL